jgi:hypothetical protein
MAGELVTLDGGIQWRGLLLGTGSVYGTTKLEGLRDLPPQRGGNSPLPNRHGSYPGQRLSGDRTITWSFKVSKIALEAFGGAIDDLLRVSAPDENPVEESLVIQLDGRQVYTEARLVRRAITADKNYLRGYVEGAVAWESTDPRLYEVSESSSSAALAVAAGGGLDFGSGGLDFGVPVTEGLDFGAGTSGGVLSAAVGGHVPTWPRFQIQGPVTGPQITYGGRTLAFDPSWTLPDGPPLIIDTRPRYLSVTLNGVSQRNRLFFAQWTPFLPGVTTQVQFSAAAYSASAQLTAFWRGAIH